MATTADFKNGLYLRYNDKPCMIVWFQHVKPGKGPAFVKTKLRNLENGRILENTFTAGAKIETIDVERRPYQYLYKDDMGYNFMNNETYEQIPIDESLLATPELLKEGESVEVVVHAETETVLAVDMPAFMTYEITYTEPGVRGDTSSTNSLKPATIETGATIMVPLFVNQGDKIKVDTRDKSYVERIK